MSWNVSYLDSSISKAQCRWKIMDFVDDEYEHVSEIFSVNTKKVPLGWRLFIPSGDGISIHLQLITENAPEIKAECEYYIIDYYGQKANAQKSSNIYGKIKSYYCDILMDRNDLATDDLTIYCVITVSDLSVKTSGTIYKLSKDLENIFNNGQYCDVEFDVSGHKIRAHKIILAARSDVFAAMFVHDMAEAKTNCAAISDIDSEVFKELLRYIYTGEASRLDELAHDLLAAADKYNLTDLKEICEEALEKSLCVEMATKTLILADLHICEQLKLKTIDFINSHAVDVVKTQDWQNIKTHTDLLEELYRAKCGMPFK